MEAERNASNARAKVRREREVSDAFAEVDRAHWMRSAAKGIAAKLLSLSPGKTPLERLKARRTPFNPTGLKREHARRERGASRAMGATDSTTLHRSTSIRRRDKTLPLLNEYVAEAGLLHLPGVECPQESDTKAYNDYKAKVCVCVCARARAKAPRARSCVRARVCDTRVRSRANDAVGAQVILASADSSLKAGMLRTLKARIDRIVHYSSVYDADMRRHSREVRARRKSTYAKVMAAVTLQATGGTIRGLAAFRRLERKTSG